MFCYKVSRITSDLSAKATSLEQNLDYFKPRTDI